MMVIYWLWIALMAAAAVIVLLGLALFLKHREVKALRNAGPSNRDRTAGRREPAVPGNRFATKPQNPDSDGVRVAEETELKTIVRRITEQALKVRRQRELVLRLAKRGLSTEAAKKSLDEMQEAFDQMRQRLQEAMRNSRLSR